MVDGLNKDVLQEMSDKQRDIANAAPEPVNEPDAVEPTEPAVDEKPPAAKAAPRAAAKKETGSK